MFRVKTYFLIIVLLVTGCAFKPETPVKAIYLVRDVGQLSPEDLQAHPEVMVTDNFETLTEIAKTKIAIWIDINAVDLVDLEWLGQSPQALYPVVLVGNGDETCSFFSTVHYFTFEIPCCLECSSPPPGFSVNIQTDISQGHMQDMKRPRPYRVFSISRTPFWIKSSEGHPIPLHLSSLEEENDQQNLARMDNTHQRRQI